MHQSILAYKKARYFWLALLLIVVSSVAYVWHQTPDPPNGGTWLGYILGTISALLIIWLMYLGIRKRQYSSTLGTVHGWTSAHVYLGASVLVLSTLHSGFQLGWNVHTLAYVLMCIVIFSGLFGIYAYLRYPRLRNNIRADLTREQLLNQIRDLDQQSIRLAGNIDAETGALVRSAAERTLVGGSWWAQIKARDDSKVVLPATYGGAAKGGATPNPEQSQLIESISTRVSDSKGGSEVADLQALLSAIATKRTLLRRIRQDVRFSALLEIWLYIHVPFSFALLAALTAHIVSVFIYW